MTENQEQRSPDPEPVPVEGEMHVTEPVPVEGELIQPRAEPADDEAPAVSQAPVETGPEVYQEDRATSHAQERPDEGSRAAAEVPIVDSPAEAEELARETGKPASQIMGESDAARQSDRERAELESRMPGGVNTVPSDPRGSQAEQDAGGPAATPASQE